jgi:hypothetical protein
LQHHFYDIFNSTGTSLTQGIFGSLLNSPGRRAIEGAVLGIALPLYRQVIHYYFSQQWL